MGEREGGRGEGEGEGERGSGRERGSEREREQEITICNTFCQFYQSVQLLIFRLGKSVCSQEGTELENLS